MKIEINIPCKVNFEDGLVIKKDENMGNNEIRLEVNVSKSNYRHVLINLTELKNAIERLA